MFRGGDQNALAHEAGGIADFGHVPADGGNFESIEIGAAKHDAGASRGGKQAHVNRRATVKANAGEFNRGGNCVFQVR